jgi:hypothetical protein
MSYATYLAAKLTEDFEVFTKEGDVVKVAYEISLKEFGRNVTDYNFYYDEDFASDLVSEYFDINKAA